LDDTIYLELARSTVLQGHGMLAAPIAGGPCPAKMLGTAPPIRDLLSQFSETRYIGIELKEQCIGERFDFCLYRCPAEFIS
jgi:hypothetical protein